MKAATSPAVTVAVMTEFLRDPLIAYVVGGVLLSGLYWSLLFALRDKGMRNDR
ncbi:hypothetical protein STLA111740_00555 [Stenotrophomonas lactitubi]